MPISQVPFAGISNPVNFRNIVINGDMSIAQRGTSQASAGSAAGAYQTLDRYKFYNNNQGAFTISQSTDVPTGQGFANSLKLDCTTADVTPAAGDYLILGQSFEGQNLQYLKKGTANALPLTASFWVNSTKTGTFICELVDTNNSRSISKSYTVSASNTWEFKTVTFPGDTTGTLANTNGSALSLFFWLGAGSTYTSGTLATSWASTVNANRAVGQVNIADSTSNDWYITGVQLEAGEQASGFETLPIDVNLARCKRYYHQTPNLSALDGSIMMIGYDATQLPCGVQFPVAMRAAPTVTSFDNTGASGGIHKFGGGDFTGVSAVRIVTTGFTNFNRSAGGIVAGAIYVATYKADAEL